MTEHRFTLIEHTVQEHGRRIDDHGAKLQTIIAWKDAIEESTEVNRKMVEVGENIITALGWVGTAAKWVTRVSLAAASIWAFIKLCVTLGLAK